MSQELPSVRQTDARKTVQVRFPDGRVLEAPRNTPLLAFMHVAFPDTGDPVVAALLNGNLVELARPVTNDAEAAPVRLSDSDGMRIYCRSLSFLLIVATYQLHPEVRLFVDYSVPHGGYFCHVQNRARLTVAELSAIKERMRELVRQDRPITRKRCRTDEALTLFASRGESSKVRLLRNYTEDHLHLYELEGFLDYFYGYMVPSTRYLATFTLETFPGGFILRFPRREDPTRLLPARRFTALREVFTEYGEWLDLLGIPDVGSLNDALRSGRSEQVILVSEALHEKRIAEIASRVARRDPLPRAVFIAGPSSSGKTTFAKRLAIQLIATGVRPHLLSMDDYFHSRSRLREQQGDALDFEALDALDTQLLQEHLHDLLAGAEVALPRYDFLTGERGPGSRVRLAADQILLIEGIHGLNPALLGSIPSEDICRVFVSCLTQLNLDSHNRVSTTDTRLIRRIARDAVSRGYSAEATLEMWENVRSGEKRNIFPFQEEADVMFNSALVYELSVLKPLVEPLLLQVRQSRLHVEAGLLLAFLSWFEPCTTDFVPGNSILREFVGGSVIEAFSPVLPSEPGSHPTSQEAPQ